MSKNSMFEGKVITGKTKTGSPDIKPKMKGVAKGRVKSARKSGK
jgi:hypothetical protein